MYTTHATNTSHNEHVGDQQVDVTPVTSKNKPHQPKSQTKGELVPDTN